MARNYRPEGIEVAPRVCSKCGLTGSLVNGLCGACDGHDIARTDAPNRERVRLGSCKADEALFIPGIRLAGDAGDAARVPVDPWGNPLDGEEME